MDYIFIIIPIFVLIGIIILFLKYKNRFNFKYGDHLKYLFDNYKILEGEIFYRELELFIKKIISIKFKKPEIIHYKTDFLIKTYNGEIIDILSEVYENKTNLDILENSKIKKKILKKLFKLLKK